MKVEIICKNYRLDENFKSLIEKKIDRLDKYFDNDATAKVKLGKQGGSFTTDVAINWKGKVIRSVSEKLRMEDNIDIIIPKLERQIIKYKSKFTDKNKTGAMPLIEEPEENTEKPSVVKVKKFAISVTTVENAIEEMSMLGHDFYVFLNGDTNKVNVLYKRTDGNLGVIEPEC